MTLLSIVIFARMETGKISRMKKNLLSSSILSLLLFSASAQVSFGVQGGAVFSKPKSTYEVNSTLPITVEASGRTGFSAGLFADLPLGESGFRLMPELSYVSKGGKGSTQFGITIPSGPQQIGLDFTSTINYLELPFNLAYSVPVSDYFIILGSGPYVAMGLNGKTKVVISDDVGVTEQEESVVFGSTGDEIRRWDYGANLMAGFIHPSGLMLKANYSLGIPNLANEGNPELRNRYFGLSLVYFLVKGGR
jgi:hypothetical protein